MIEMPYFLYTLKHINTWKYRECLREGQDDVRDAECTEYFMYAQVSTLVDEI